MTLVKPVMFLIINVFLKNICTVFLHGVFMLGLKLFLDERVERARSSNGTLEWRKNVRLWVCVCDRDSDQTLVDKF